MAVQIAWRMLVLMARYAVHDRFSSCHATSERRSGASATIVSAVCIGPRLALPLHRSFCAPSTGDKRVMLRLASFLWLQARQSLCWSLGALVQQPVGVLSISPSLARRAYAGHAKCAPSSGPRYLSTLENRR